MKRQTGTATSDDGRPVIVFSHANGFPAGTYRQLFEAWRGAGFEVHALERFGHDPAYPVRSNWAWDAATTGLLPVGPPPTRSPTSRLWHRMRPRR